MRIIIHISLLTFSILTMFSLAAQNTQTGLRQETDSSVVPDWSVPIGFASIDGDNFKGHTTGGGEISASDNIVYIDGLSEFT